jgi:hypothetical protein
LSVIFYHIFVYSIIMFVLVITLVWEAAKASSASGGGTNSSSSVCKVLDRVLLGLIAACVRVDQCLVYSARYIQPCTQSTGLGSRPADRRGADQRWRQRMGGGQWKDILHQGRWWEPIITYIGVTVSTLLI